MATLRSEPPFGGLEALYTVHLRLTEKLIVDYLFVLIELFSATVIFKAEALRANIDWKKSAFFEGQNFKISIRRCRSPPTIFLSEN